MVKYLHMSTNRETGVYSHTNNRVHETRGLQQIDKFWADLGMGDIDTQFSHQLDLAIAQKRSEINFLDFGSGEDATLLKQIVGEIGHRDTDYLVRTGTLLSEHPDLRLNMIGLTDALSPFISVSAEGSASLSVNNLG